VKQAGLYSKTYKLNLLLAICGDDELPLRWRDIWTGEGTTRERMIAFVKKILDQLKTLKDDDRRFCFVMDNLRSHHINKWELSLLILGTGLYSGHHTIQLMVRLNMYSTLFKVY